MAAGQSFIFFIQTQELIDLETLGEKAYVCDFQPVNLPHYLDR